MIGDDNVQTVIPQIEDPEAYFAINDTGSEFLEIFDGEIFDVKMQYCGKAKNAVSRCLVRKEIFDKLKKAQSLLPEGIRLRIWDAWRPYALQNELYKKYSAFLTEKFSLFSLPEEGKKKVITKYISFPEKDKSIPPVHTTGGAVDVTLVDEFGCELDMGTRFDEFSEKAHTAYFEGAFDKCAARENRRILYNAMIGAGFTNLPSEWWHYDYGDKFWAYYNNTPAIYSGIFDIEEILLK